jgi:hypothetical protein
VVITRRSARFGQLAGDVDQLLTERGLSVAAHVFDVVLNERIADVAALLGISARASLDLTPASLPRSVADAITEAASSM